MGDPTNPGISTESLLTWTFEPAWLWIMTFMDAYGLLMVLPTVCKYINNLSIKCRVDLNSIPSKLYTGCNIFNFISESTKQIARPCSKKTKFGDLSTQHPFVGLDDNMTLQLCCALTGTCSEIPNEMAFTEEYWSPREPPSVLCLQRNVTKLLDKVLLLEDSSVHLVAMADSDPLEADQLLSIIIRPTDLANSPSHFNGLDMLLSRKWISLRSLMLCHFSLNQELINKIEKLELGFLCLNDCPIHINNLDFRNHFASLNILHIVLHSSTSGTLLFPRQLEELVIYGPNESRTTLEQLVSMKVNLKDCKSLRNL